MTGNRGQKTENRSRLEAAPTVSRFLNPLMRNFDFRRLASDISPLTSDR
jgi:hypothetical protein